MYLFIDILIQPISKTSPNSEAPYSHHNHYLIIIITQSQIKYQFEI